MLNWPSWPWTQYIWNILLNNECSKIDGNCHVPPAFSALFIKVPRCSKCRINTLEPNLFFNQVRVMESTLALSSCWCYSSKGPSWPEYPACTWAHLRPWSTLPFGPYEQLKSEKCLFSVILYFPLLKVLHIFNILLYFRNILANFLSQVIS